MESSSTSAQSRPASLTDERVALIGDAGCQVFAAHGSGIGYGLIAARLLADTLAAGAPLHHYAKAWHRQYGGLFAAYDLFRRLSQTLTVPDLERMMDSGLMDPDTVRFGMAQTMPYVPIPTMKQPPFPLPGRWNDGDQMRVLSNDMHSSGRVNQNHVNLLVTG